VVIVQKDPKLRIKCNLMFGLKKKAKNKNNEKYGKKNDGSK
jgi:hypothetical protein